MEDGDIPDDNIQASHTSNPERLAKHSRLNGDSMWAAGSTNDALKPWIQADIGNLQFFNNFNYPIDLHVPFLEDRK